MKFVGYVLPWRRSALSECSCFCMWKFHQYVYGKCVHVQSYHRPLESILKKILVVSPARLQRMMLRLQKYDVHMAYKPGKEIPVADVLLRKPFTQRSDDLQECIEMQIHTVIRSLPVWDKKLRKIKSSIQDNEYCANYKTQYYRDDKQVYHDLALIASEITTKLLEQ